MSTTYATAGTASVTTAKPWWRSRTLIVNAIVLALLAAESQLQILQAVLPVDVYSVAAFALPIVNAVLRVITVAPVSGLPGLGASQAPREPQP